MVDWKEEYTKLQRTCKKQDRLSARDLAVFGVGGAVVGGAVAALWHFRKDKVCECTTALKSTPAGANGNGGNGANGNGGGNGANGNGGGNGGGNGANGGGMVPGDS